MRCQRLLRTAQAVACGTAASLCLGPCADCCNCYRPVRALAVFRRLELNTATVLPNQRNTCCKQLLARCTPDVIDVRVRSDADPTPCPFFCCAAVLSLSTCSSFALAWCAKVLTSFMMSCRAVHVGQGQHKAHGVLPSQQHTAANLLPQPESVWAD